MQELKIIARVVKSETTRVVLREIIKEEKKVQKRRKIEAKILFVGAI